jgi:ribosomal protein S12 methylthiotransferase
VGKSIEVIVDEVDQDGAIARSAWDAPEIDGNVYLNGEMGLRVGDRARVTVEASDDYDLWASVTENAPALALAPAHAKATLR